jgi:hypothetical protein
MSRILNIAMFLALIPATVDVALAYRWERCGLRDQRLKWDHGSVHFRVDGETFPPGSPFRAAVDEAASAWNRTPSNFRYNLTYDEPRVGKRNGQNEIWWSEELDEDDPPAVTYYRFRPVRCEFREADIVFNRVRERYWVLAPGNKRLFVPYGGYLRPFQTTAMHEFGHAQGLNHEERLYNVMGDDRTHIHANGNTASAYPGVDAARGSMDTYGRLAPGHNQDLSVAHFKRTADDGDYSIHGRTLIYDSSGVPLAVRSDGEPRFLVRPGQTIQVEFGYESLGVPGTSLMVSYHLSANNEITTADPVLATRFFSLADSTPVDAASTRITFRLPASLTVGARYWIGAVIDPWNVMAEIDETNNATYIGIEVIAP